MKQTNPSTAIRFAKEKVTLNINLSYTNTRGAMVN